MTKASTHTPGPWASYEDDVVVDPNAGGQMESPFGACTADGAGIAAAWCGWSCGKMILLDEAQANARLIAAAPELLDALKDLLPLLYAHPEPLGDNILDQLAKALAVVAKAEGGAA